MRTTIKLSLALVTIQEEATERIKSFFKNKPYVRIMIEPGRNLKINTGTGIGTVTEVNLDGCIYFNQNDRKVVSNPKFCDSLPADALLTILDELERMKKTNLFKKP